jgi:alkanesulfonate monooxygenase SsuD/methylene tetrahydromethanopterin reductase-like flavin-dependent oxidoreductase (luciferase family)
MAETAYNPPLFGMSFAPSARNAQQAFALAKAADSTGLDFITIQDHPYNPTFLDTWTLFAALGASTQHARLLPNVLNLPLRPPAMLAKEAATLDILTNGRVEIGLGAGAFWEGVVSYGGLQRTPGEAVSALEEAMQIMKALWQPLAAGQAVSFDGKYYQLHNAQPGPAPRHAVGIWLGALGPRMLELTGRMADGWLVSASYSPPENIPAMQAKIDEAALAAGRTTNAIRRGYNLAGVVQQPGTQTITARRKDIITGPANQWVDVISHYYHDLRMDTFIFWPLGGEEAQIRHFAEEVVPAVRAAVTPAHQS